MAELLLLFTLGAVVFALAALAQAITGFGLVLVAVPLLTLVAEPLVAVVAATSVSLILSAGAAWQERVYIEVPMARNLSVTGILGIPLGLLVLQAVDEDRLQVLIAVTMLVAVPLVASGAHVGARGAPIAGVLSGTLLASTGMNGPPLVLALIDREPRRYRATLQSVFTVQDAVAVAAFAALGYVTLEVVLLIAGGVLGLRLGWRLGDAVFRRIPAARLRLSIVIGLMLLAAWMLMAVVW